MCSLNRNKNMHQFGAAHEIKNPFHRAMKTNTAVARVSHIILSNSKQFLALGDLSAEYNVFKVYMLNRERRQN